ncbi:MAG: FtsX-like permease family protein [Paenibacillus sp.]|nr:FtsX-like permease family protein [Paenibacillus sp.]
MLINVVNKNIKGNFKNYLMYFISMIISVVIYYTFVALQYRDEIRANTESWELMRSIMVQASIILILFVAIFIWYSNAFFTRKRKKEVGLFSLLGVRKKTIGRMLFYENMIMGIIALGIGIVLGALLSKLFTMILLHLLGAAIEVGFNISLSAVINTIIVFVSILLLTSFQSYRLIYRFRLIELFQADKEGEQAPKTSVITASIGMVLLVFSYWILYQDTSAFHALFILTLFLVSLVIGTYLLFRSIIVYLLRVMQRNKSLFYKGTNLISTSQLLYRMKGNARILTMVALLSALTLCAVSVGYSSYYGVEKSAANYAPFSYTHRLLDDSFNEQVRGIIADDKEHRIQSEQIIQVLEIKGDLSDTPFVPYGFTANDVPVKIIAASTYNKLASTLKRDNTLQLTGNQMVGIRSISDPGTSDNAGRQVVLTTSQGQQKLTYVTMLEDRIMSWVSPDMYMIVGDAMYDSLAEHSTKLRYVIYKVEDQQRTKTTALQLNKLQGAEQAELTSYYLEYRKRLEAAGLDIFLLGFLGLVFLAATGSIIYFKQLTEAHSDKGRYETLRKLGVSRRDVMSTVAMQLLFVFLLPLIVGIAHSIMILKGIFQISLFDRSLAIPILTSMIAYVVLYLGYYVLTLHSSNYIVNK